MKIGIINGSIRTKRATEAVANYIQGVCDRRSSGTTYELIDLAEFQVPLLTSPVHPMAKQKKYDEPNVQRWSDAIDACDGFIFVTPEYNHGVPGGFKNAVDSLGTEWVGKPVAFVSHGSVSGVRAVEQWRQILTNFSMPLVRSELNFNMFVHWKDGEFVPDKRHDKETNAMCDELEKLVTTMRG
ncbi:MAG TPA: NAD(P)H-dependent oxidoreductase [Candidatus Stackebrandtia faecavium]|nr:NAD(P)H-dependent oxidoreductase [Candidatus Stackebrandtia faecavium]